jgi:hypothetical protein
MHWHRGTCSIPEIRWPQAAVKTASQIRIWHAVHHQGINLERLADD